MVQKARKPQYYPASDPRQWPFPRQRALAEFRDKLLEMRGGFVRNGKKVVANPKAILAEIGKPGNREKWLALRVYDKATVFDIGLVLTPEQRRSVSLAGNEKVGGGGADPKTGKSLIFGMDEATYRRGVRTRYQIDAQEKARAEAGKAGKPKGLQIFGQDPVAYRKSRQLQLQIDREEEARDKQVRVGAKGLGLIYGQTEDQFRASQGRAAEIIAEEEAKARNGKVYGMTPADYLAQEKLAVALRQQAKETVVGTPDVQGAWGELQAGGFNPDKVVELEEMGLWDEVQRLHPDALGRAVENWGKRIDAETLAVFKGDYGKYKINRQTLGQVSQEQLNRAASADPKFAAALRQAKVQFGRPAPLGNFVKSVNYLKANPGTDPVLLNLPASGLPGMQVPIPKIDLKGLWTIKPQPEAPTPSGAAGGLKVGVGVPAPQAKSDALNLYYIPKAQATITRPDGATLIKGGAPALSGAGVPAKKPSALTSAGKALPDLVGLAMQAGVIPQKSPVAGAMGAYSMYAATTALLTSSSIGLSMAVAGPIGWAVAIGSMLGWLGNRDKEAEAHRKMHGAAASRSLATHVGYVPRDAVTRYQKAGGTIKPFRSMYSSNLGLARTTQTPLAKI